MDAELKQTLAEMRQETRELIERHVGGLREEMRDGLAQHVGGLRQEMHDRFESTRELVESEVGGLRQELHTTSAQLRQEIGDLDRRHTLHHVETRRHFDVTVERMDHRYDALAEAFLALDEKADRRVRGVESDVAELKETTPKTIEYAIRQHEKRRH